MHRPALLLLATALLFAAAACGGDEEIVPDAPGIEEAPAEEAPAEEEPVDTFEIVLTSFELDPSTLIVDEAGTYTLRAVNEGDHPHAFAIAGPGVDDATETLQPGESAELVVTFEAGEYEVWCPVPGHRDEGMEGSVGVGPAIEVEDDEDEQETDDGNGVDYP